MLAYFCSLDVVQKRDWLLKASSFDDQIIIFLFNKVTHAQHVKIFYDEEAAYFFIERIVNGT